MPIPCPSVACSYFHLGHAASTDDNPLATRGIPTAITLAPEGEAAIPYVFGVAATPAGFDAVVRIEEEDGGILLLDRNGREAFAALDVSFVTNPG